MAVTSRGHNGFLLSGDGRWRESSGHDIENSGRRHSLTVRTKRVSTQAALPHAQQLPTVGCHVAINGLIVQIDSRFFSWVRQAGNLPGV